MSKQTLSRQKLIKRKRNSKGTKKKQYGGRKSGYESSSDLEFNSNNHNQNNLQTETVVFTYDKNTYTIELPSKLTEEEQQLIIIDELNKFFSGNKTTTIKQKKSSLKSQTPSPPRQQLTTSSKQTDTFSSSPTRTSMSSPSKPTSSPKQGTNKKRPTRRTRKKKRSSSRLIERPVQNINNVGINNTGVICWLISCIQLLYTIEELRKYFIEDFDIDSIDVSTSPEARNLVICLSIIFKEIHYKNDSHPVDLQDLEFEDNGTYNVYKIIKNLLLTSPYGLSVITQCDADEGLVYLLDLIFEAAPALQNLFNINLKTYKYCEKSDDNPVSVINEFLHKIRLPINLRKSQVKLTSIITKYQKKKKLSSDNYFTTDNCPNNEAKATQETINPINNKYLIIQLIRCLRHRKDNTIVSNDDEISINGNDFKLRGIISHRGDTCNSGHYYYYRKLDDGTIVKLNDGEHINDENFDINSYIFLYERVMN